MVALARVVVAAPASGQGKTSVATGLLSALRARGMTVSGHKVGPDYIDPSYHGLAAGRPGRNLDPWLVGEQRIAPLFARAATTPTTADVCVIEGVMGLFDGASGHEGFASTAHVARLIGAPVLLVIDASGVGRSVAAIAHGFASFDPSVRLAGVIFNRVGSPRHEQILREAMAETGLPVLGAIGRHSSLVTPSRHLGLIPAAERCEQAMQTVQALGAAVADGVDLDAVVRIARSAPPLETEAVADLDDAPAPIGHRGAPVRIAVAGGAAFTFGYAEQSELLAAAGAEVVSFDPLQDERLPEGVDGLVIGGGFPESHAQQLAGNRAMCADVAALARAGAPVAAECAGLLYLARSLDGHRMCGFLDAEAVMSEHLTLGYRDAVATTDSALAIAGTRVRGHEFHRTIYRAGPGAIPAWRWRRGADTVADGFVAGNVHASYLHLHWAGIDGIAQTYVAACASARSARLAR
ncbi:MAG: cobyrinate a,c-diamide synthase [Actinomycetota bacterium]|nr:cobyrinate a,c-diamide synthase [Actinomycetota bacterium]